ncbi:MAG: hypothetical protein M3O78_05800 [Chloroflexota bacterium]|nr:hypothetical protein [Chloroflexota bacterium]
MSAPRTAAGRRPAGRRPTVRRPSSRPAAFKRAAYEQEAEEFLAEREEETYQCFVGLRDRLALAEIYERHAGLFSRSSIEALGKLAESSGPGAARDRALLAFATDGFIDNGVSTLTDAIATAEANAVVIWRGEEIRYRALRGRISEIDGRAERNALYASYLEAEEAINPIRQGRIEQIGAWARQLGYADYVELVATTRGYDPDAVGLEARGFLDELETQYFSALRRYLARIEIEQGDASLADLWYLLRGLGWDHWFDARHLMVVLEATLRGLGIDLGAQPGATLDLAARPNKSSRGFVAPVHVPGDVRLVIQPSGGWGDFAAVLHEAGHLEHFLHVDPDLPLPFRALGDQSVSEGYARSFERLVGEPAWLMEQLGMPLEHADGFADFFAFFILEGLRSLVASHLHQLRLHRGGEVAVQRAHFAGLMTMLTGVRHPEERFLVTVDDGLLAAADLRGAMLDASLTDSLKAHHGEAWWRSAAAGDTLRRAWQRGQEWNAERVVAHLGYDSLDWRPVVRQIRAKLIGEMSGYGGPNITTRAGTRKV